MKLIPKTATAIGVRLKRDLFAKAGMVLVIHGDDVRVMSPDELKREFTTVTPANVSPALDVAPLKTPTHGKSWVVGKWRFERPQHIGKSLAGMKKSPHIPRVVDFFASLPDGAAPKTANDVQAALQLTHAHASYVVLKCLTEVGALDAVMIDPGNAYSVGFVKGPKLAAFLDYITSPFDFSMWTRTHGEW